MNGRCSISRGISRRSTVDSRLPWFAALTLALTAAPLAAQSVPSACTAPDGQPVQTVVKNDMVWAGEATRRGDTPVIYWSPDNLAGASQATRLFIYLHECAHHMLGHTWQGESPRAEREADCWAMTLMIESGMAKERHIELIVHELKRSEGDDMHLGGEALIRSLKQCIRNRTDPDVWAAALDTLLRASADSFRSIQGAPYPRPDIDRHTYQSTLDVASTFDCTIGPLRIMQCMVFAAKDDKRIRKRFDQLATIIRHWLPAGWASREDEAADGQVLRALHAADPGTGAGLALLQTSTRRIVFRFTPAL